MKFKKNFFLLLYGAWSIFLIQGSGFSKPPSHDEFRGAWVPTVVNLSFPSRMGLSAQQQKKEIITLLETARAARLNTLFFQVRPEADTFYNSPSEPWSRYLTGTQGTSPGFDPLQFFIEEGHRRGIAIHAWFNPYRASMNISHPCAFNHVSHKAPQMVCKVGKMLWLDPGNIQAQHYIISVIHELITHYQVDGVHLDDYFYPYPELLEGKKFPDTASYNAYRASGGTDTLDDWRRASVNSLVKNISIMVHQTRPGLLFGISPFGIYTKGAPNNVTAGLDQFHQLYADPLLWMREGWVDYMAPQLYWRDAGPQSFRLLLRWWRSPQVNPRNIPIYPGIALENLTEHHWPVQEIAQQLKIEKAVPTNHHGFILWNIKQLKDNTKGVLSLFRKSY
ncbi:MAG: family 10 glycosylhydrolase [Verrucomicrobia bacterium]|jgi:uncharacterized lipoprotein YddW (UPF0748 family)|nr:MAG: family 10 glycosylhydrolase [Verrucomicrobiota bacterium]MDH4469785.1 family 10 glycosylhydrolase [Verrucomicrobiae bacterium]